MKEIRRQIKEQDFQRVYLLTGDENYLILQAKELLVHAMVAEGDEMNYAVFEDSKIDLQQLRELAMTYPLFATKRVLVLDRTGIFKSGKDAFVEILQALPETTCVIICEPEVDKRSKAYKWIKKNGYVGEFLKKDQTEKVLMRWVAALLGKEKKKIRESDVRFFLERVGDDMFQIKNETDKLISYVGERKEIRREDIEQITSGEVQNKIFELVAAIAEGKKRQALAYYDDLILLKEPPMRILFLIVRQYRILLLISNMRSLRKPDKDIAQAAGIPAFAIRKNAAQLGGYTVPILEHCIASCIQVEEEIKTGRISDQIGLETLIVGLSERIA
ncbi:MAG TPA: DNA polymerase III subunit delta [Candidatus Anaerobutyricum avicola]|nr:DNA polymerase III subunit delta [Candidatus Anaerobutyricum avicola]